MDASMGIAGAAALGVALVLMYVVLRKYTYPAVEQPFFSDPSLFILFTVGLIEGTILFVAFTWIAFPWYSTPGLGFLVAVLFGAVMELVKLVTLNLRRYAGKSDTVFYGFGLGLGMGAAMGFGIIYYLTSRSDLDAASWVIVMVMAVQFIFLNAGTGLRVGEGVARKKTTEYLMLALFVDMGFQLLMVPTFTFMSLGDDVYFYSYFTLAAATILVIANLYVMVWKKLPGIIDDILKSQGKKRNDIPGLD